LPVESRAAVDCRTGCGAGEPLFSPGCRCGGPLERLHEGVAAATWRTSCQPDRARGGLSGRTVHFERERDFELVRRVGRGTFAPARRASDRPMAIACLRLVTRFPERPLRRVPRLRSRIARSTRSDAALPYLAICCSCSNVCVTPGCPAALEAQLPSGVQGPYHPLRVFREDRTDPLPVNPASGCKNVSPPALQPR
jgi:hypothetical protein